ncbi:MAG: VOC family protein [Acidimicrobiales bacterium]
MPLSPASVATRDDLPDWRVFLRRLEATFTAIPSNISSNIPSSTGTAFRAAAAFIETVAQAADEADHHPDVDLRYPGRVHVVLTTHAARGLTDRDITLAKAVSELAAAAGMVSDPTSASVLELAVDAVDIAAIRPFWKAVLGYRDEPVAKGETPVNLIDPLGVGPAVWFQQMDAPRPQRNRIHLDINVAHDIAEARVASAITAGGRLISDRDAKAFWVLADPEGNEICVCTWQDRDQPAD